MSDELFTAQDALSSISSTLTQSMRICGSLVLIESSVETTLICEPAVSGRYLYIYRTGTYESVDIVDLYVYGQLADPTASK